MNRRYVFGPVASRRLGVSLGIDLVEPKTCPLDCVYCEARATTKLTLERREYVPVSRILAELEHTLKDHPKLDCITFSGSGEPTLNSKIGMVIEFLKRNYREYKICLLTNGLLLGDAELRREIEPVDLVVPSLDASDAAEFAAVNRPVAGADFDKFIADLTDFSANASQVVNLELFIVPGVNDSDASIERFIKLIRPMRPALVQLNSLDRPGTVPDLKASTPENTARFIAALRPFVPVEAVGPFRYRSASHPKLECSDPERRIMDLISRRPATLPDLVLALGMDEEQIQRHLDVLFDAGWIGMEKKPRGLFYLAVHQLNGNKK